MKHRTIAVDFDGCLCEDRFPGIGPPIASVIAALKAARAAGAWAILWTCRTGEQLQAAVDWCAARGIVFDTVNANLPEQIDQYGGDTRKICADEYWDDRAVRMPPGESSS